MCSQDAHISRHHNPSRVHLLRKIDIAIAGAYLQILDPSGQGLDERSSRYQRTILKLSTPTPRGCGLFPPSDQAAIAWWASIQASLVEDRDLFHIRHSLVRHVQPAWEYLTSALTNGEFSSMGQVAHMIVSPADLLNGEVLYPGDRKSVV